VFLSLIVSASESEPPGISVRVLKTAARQPQLPGFPYSIKDKNGMSNMEAFVKCKRIVS
jgi:hypothetical protein